MNRICVIIVLCAVMLQNAGAQNQPALTIRFAKDKFELTEENKRIINTLADTLLQKKRYKIFINGYTDSDADSSYNIRLSLKRSLSVKYQLMLGGVDSTVITTRALGEEQPLVTNSTPLGKARNRRVEVFVLFEQTTIIQEVVRDTAIANETVCDGDTLVELNDGYKTFLSRCDWENNKECLTVIKNFRYNYRIKESWLKKHIGFSNYRKYIAVEPHYEFTITGCRSSCFEKPVRLYIPLHQATGLGITRQNQQKKNDKGGSASLTFKRGKVGDSAYYVTYIYCPFSCAFDNRCQHPVKLKAKRGVRLVTYSYLERSRSSYFDSVVQVTPVSHRIQTDYYPHMVFYNLRVAYRSDTIEVRSIPIDIFPNNHRKIKTSAPWMGKKYILFIPFRRYNKCGHYKLYKLRPRDLKRIKKWNDQIPG